MKSQNIFLANWQLQDEGGLNESDIDLLLEEGTREKMFKWASRIAGEEYVKAKSLKDILDLSSWCLYGAQVLSDLPSEIKNYRLAAVAPTFGLEQGELVSLICTANKLEEK